MVSEQVLWHRAKADFARYKKEPPPFRKQPRDGKALEHYRGDSIEMAPPLAREFAEWACAELGWSPLGHEDREVYITPFPGHYGLSGYVVTLNGSPSRVVMVVLVGSGQQSVWLTRDGHRRVVGYPHCPGVREQRYKMALRFLRRAGVKLHAGVSTRDVRTEPKDDTEPLIGAPRRPPFNA